MRLIDLLISIGFAIGAWLATRLERRRLTTKLTTVDTPNPLPSDDFADWDRDMQTRSGQNVRHLLHGDTADSECPVCSLEAAIANEAEQKISAVTLNALMNPTQAHDVKLMTMGWTTTGAPLHRVDNYTVENGISPVSGFRGREWAEIQSTGYRFLPNETGHKTLDTCQDAHDLDESTRHYEAHNHSYSIRCRGCGRTFRSPSERVA